MNVAFTVIAMQAFVSCVMVRPWPQRSTLTPATLEFSPAKELFPFRMACPPPSQLASQQRHAVMRKSRSQKNDHLAERTRTPNSRNQQLSGPLLVIALRSGVLSPWKACAQGPIEGARVLAFDYAISGQFSSRRDHLFRSLQPTIVALFFESDGEPGTG